MGNSDPVQIAIKINGRTLRVSLWPTPSAQKLVEHLPLQSVVMRWGDEIYFRVPFHCEPEPAAREEVRVGELAFWPDGDCLCLFFGPTPASTNEQPRAIGPVNVIGVAIGELGWLREVKEGACIRLEPLGD